MLLPGPSRNPPIASVEGLKVTPKALLSMTFVTLSGLSADLEMASR
jgi:hypothetical protein